MGTSVGPVRTCGHRGREEEGVAGAAAVRRKGGRGTGLEERGGGFPLPVVVDSNTQNLSPSC